MEFILFHWILLKIQTLINVLTSMDLLTYLKFWHFVLAFQILIQAKAIVLSCFEKLRLGFILIDSFTLCTYVLTIDAVKENYLFRFFQAKLMG